MPCGISQLLCLITLLLCLPTLNYLFPVSRLFSLVFSILASGAFSHWLPYSSPFFTHLILAELSRRCSPLAILTHLVFLLPFCSSIRFSSSRSSLSSPLLSFLSQVVSLLMYEFLFLLTNLFVFLLMSLVLSCQTLSPVLLALTFVHFGFQLPYTMTLTLNLKLHPKR